MLGQSYGASAGPRPGEHRAPFAKRGEAFLRWERKRLNVVAILLSLFVPWLMFCFLFAALSFRIHYERPVLCWFLVFVVFICGVVLPAVVAYIATRRRKSYEEYDEAEPTWWRLFAFMSALAFVSGLVFGFLNYSLYMESAYDLQNLATYKDVDIQGMKGEQLMDAGRVTFAKGTRLDLHLSMGFKNVDVYCVAPIINGMAAPVTFDFWAVGKNCCSGVQADFHCGAFRDPNANGGVRLLHDEDRPFYRLAVQEAEATHKIEAKHPIFFLWGEDPIRRTDDFQHSGYVNYFLGCAAYFGLQAFIVGFAVLAFSKLPH